MIKKTIKRLKYRAKKLEDKYFSIRGNLYYAKYHQRKPKLKKTYIPPEIFKDEFSAIIEEVLSNNPIRKIIEVGPSSGEGSTAAILKGQRDKSRYDFHLIEIDELRFLIVKEKLKNKRNVSVHHGSTIAMTDFPDWDKIKAFYETRATNLNKHTLETVKSWYESDRNKIQNLSQEKLGLLSKIIDGAPHEFDFVLIDGGEFSGLAELELVYGAKFIALDDINSFKCYDAFHLLKNSKEYRVYAENWELRNGFAVFSRAY